VERSQEQPALRSELACTLLAKWIWRGAEKSESLVACTAVRFGKTKAGPRFNTDNLMKRGRKIMTRHNLQFVTAACALLLGIASAASAVVPPMEVTVFDASGKVGFKGATNANGTFATANLQPGQYVVQFNTKSAAAKGNQYLLVVSAGKKKVIATGVSGETFIGGGAAMRVSVGSGLKITGQVANEQNVVREGGLEYRVIDGHRFVWVAEGLGSNMGGRWVEESLAPARNVIRLSKESFARFQDRSGEGSMAEWDRHQEGRY
jgi:hypothetical protein